MNETSQIRAVRNHRARLAERGLTRFEVVGRPADRALIRSLAKRLAENDPEANELRTSIGASLGTAPPKGRILEALRRAPLRDLDLAASRPFETGRETDL